MGSRRSTLCLRPRRAGYGRFALPCNQISRLTSTFGQPVMGWSCRRVGGSKAAPTQRVLIAAVRMPTNRFSTA